jgi:hypothetical protein
MHFMFRTGGFDPARATPHDFARAKAWLIGTLADEREREVVRSITLADVRDAEMHFRTYATREAQRLHDEGEDGLDDDPAYSAWVIRHHRR